MCMATQFVLFMGRRTGPPHRILLHGDSDQIDAAGAAWLAPNVFISTAVTEYFVP
jgi:hypothetical protein